MCLNNKSQEESHVLEWKTPGQLFSPSHCNPFGHVLFVSLYLFFSLCFSLSCFFFCLFLPSLSHQFNLRLEGIYKDL